jgi:hypothetical protein
MKSGALPCYRSGVPPLLGGRLCGGLSGVRRRRTTPSRRRRARRPLGRLPPACALTHCVRGPTALVAVLAGLVAGLPVPSAGRGRARAALAPCVRRRRAGHAVIRGVRTLAGVPSSRWRLIAPKDGVVRGHGRVSHDISDRAIGGTCMAVRRRGRPFASVDKYSRPRSCSSRSRTR